MKNKKILVIENDPTILKILQSRFAEEKEMELSAATHAEEGLRKAEEIPNVILLDIGLPNNSGTELVKTLKKNKTTKAIPLIIFSTLGKEDIIKEAEKLGADDYIIKGTISLKEVIAKIKNFLAKNDRS